MRLRNPIQQYIRNVSVVVGAYLTCTSRLVGVGAALFRDSSVDIDEIAMMVRGNLPAAMQGMVVVPIFAGYDLRREIGRLWDYDATGGRYEERDHVATGSGSLHAGTVVKVGFRVDLTRDEAVDLAAKALADRPQ